MPISNPISIPGIGSIDLSPLEDKLAALELENEAQANAIAALQAAPISTQSINSGEDDMQNWQLRTANYTAQNRDRIIADVSLSEWELKLPASPTYGHEVEILIDGSNDLNFNGNGEPVNGQTEVFSFNGDRAKLAIVYKDLQKGWLVGVGTSGNTGGEDGGNTGGGGGTPPSNSPVGVEYALSQSSIYPGTPNGSYANLTDNDTATGTGTNGGDSWIKATFPSPVLVTAVTCSGGYVPNFGPSTPYGSLQYSTDDTAWTTVLTISEVSSSGANITKKFTLPTPTEAKYWRIYAPSNYLSITEFKFE